MRSPRSIKHSRDFESLVVRGRRARRDGITVYVAERPGVLDASRLGISVRSGSAVRRNRVRRRLRSAFRDTGAGRRHDVLIRATDDVVGLTSVELRDALSSALRETGALPPSGDAA